MAAPIVYKSTDASAPTLNGQKGSLITVLKACLVNGYGSKAAAGWTLATEDAGNYKAIFRNDSVNGSGRYFRIQDNGRIAADGAGSYYAQDRACNAALVGMHSYSDINTPVMPFPRVMAGGDYHNAYAYGVSIRKSYTTTNPTYVKPWIVIADSRTCYLITFPYEGNSTTIPTTNDSANSRGITAFGDLKAFNPASANVAKSFVMGSILGTLDVSMKPGSEGTLIYGGPADFYFNNWSQPTVFVDRLIESGSKTCSAVAKPPYYLGLIGGNCTPTPADNTYLPYPSPLSAGYEIQPIIIAEQPNDVVRSVRTVHQYCTDLGVFPGVYGCLHSTSAAYMAINTAELGTFTKDSRDYMIYSICPSVGTDTVRSTLLAFDMGDWWA